MYLFMVICIYISVSAIGAFKMTVPFYGEIWRNGSFRVRVGVSASYSYFGLSLNKRERLSPWC